MLGLFDHVGLSELPEGLSFLLLCSSWSTLVLLVPVEKVIVNEKLLSFLMLILNFVNSLA